MSSYMLFKMEFVWQIGQDDTVGLLLEGKCNEMGQVDSSDD